MKRSKAFFVATIKNNRKRMLATFERARLHRYASLLSKRFGQAKKHTQQLLENNHQMQKNISSLRENDVLKKSIDSLKGLLPKMRKTYIVSITWLGAFFPKDIDVSSFTRNISENIKRFSSETYSRFVIRGEYTKRSLIILFILACSLGIVIKVIAVQGVTIGFEDYTLAPHKTLYDINLLQQKIIDQGNALSQNRLPEGGMCQEAE